MILSFKRLHWVTTNTKTGKIYSTSEFSTLEFYKQMQEQSKVTKTVAIIRHLGTKGSEFPLNSDELADKILKSKFPQDCIIQKYY
jgi:hypothetical protein